VIDVPALPTTVWHIHVAFVFDFLRFVFMVLSFSQIQFSAAILETASAFSVTSTEYDYVQPIAGIRCGVPNTHSQLRARDVVNSSAGVSGTYTENIDRSIRIRLNADIHVAAKCAGNVRHKEAHAPRATRINRANNRIVCRINVRRC
jgi:hypothetical protein